MDGWINGWTDWRKKEWLKGWVDGETDLYVIRYDDNQMFLLYFYWRILFTDHLWRSSLNNVSYTKIATYYEWPLCLFERNSTQSRKSWETELSKWIAWQVPSINLRTMLTVNYTLDNSSFRGERFSCHMSLCTKMYPKGRVELERIHIFPNFGEEKKKSQLSSKVW